MKNLFKSAPKTNAAAILEHLENMEKKNRYLNEDMISLYPEQPSDIVKSYLDKSVQEAQDNARYQSFIKFSEDMKNDLLSTAIFESCVYPVLEMNFAKDREAQLAYKTVSDFVLKEGYYNLINKFKYENYYLAEMANLVESYANDVISEADEKIKEGLSEKDAYNIENQKIDDFILNSRDIVPKDITKTIQDRVQNSINDFVDENKTNKFKIKEIYDNAKMKIAQADGVEDGEAIQQEALRFARGQERTLITECATNLFGSIVKIMTESVFAIKSLQETYMDKDNGSNKVNFSKVVGDASAIFTVMESMNTLGIITVNEDYVKNTIDELKQSMADTIENEKLDPIKNTHVQNMDTDNELPVNTIDDNTVE